MFVCKKRHFELSFLRHSERSEESITSTFSMTSKTKAENYGFFGRVPLPLNDGRIAQLGRSMIEMLGVLAIIGVLSIGGISLYRRAVNNHHANTILDDANRFAFVITEKGGFPANDNITNVNFEKTSTYEMAAFVGEKSGQYGILVGNLPKGVCEPLVDKANIDYKVRVMPAESFTYIDEIANTGLVYDSFNKDICINDSNDVVLFFGDTSGQCNKPKEGEDYAPCNTNAECCGGSFCAFQNPNSSVDKGEGKCQTITYFEPSPTTLKNGQVWVRSQKGMTWWSAENWCLAQGRKMPTRTDLGCGKCIGTKRFCTTEECESGLEHTLHYAYEGSVLRELQSNWNTPSNHWIVEYKTALYFRESQFYSSAATNPHYALCQ